MTDHSQILLIGVFPTAAGPGNLPGGVGFVYSTNAPDLNFWVSQRLTDGSLQGHEVMAMGLNDLIEADATEGDFADVKMYGDYSLRFTVGEILDRTSDEVQAHQADFGTPVRRVTTTIANQGN